MFWIPSVNPWPPSKKRSCQNSSNPFLDAMANAYYNYNMPHHYYVCGESRLQERCTTVSKKDRSMVYASAKEALEFKVTFELLCPSDTRRIAMNWGVVSFTVERRTLRTFNLGTSFYFLHKSLQLRHTWIHLIR